MNPTFRSQEDHMGTRHARHSHADSLNAYQFKRARGVFAVSSLNLIPECDHLLQSQQPACRLDVGLVLQDGILIVL